MRVLFWLPFLLLCLGCLWDRDTLTDDARGRMGVAKVIVGWFDRNPDRYYELRLERVLGELENSPEGLELYDDAAVALDRLHRSEKAIALMKRKAQVMRSFDPVKHKKLLWEHKYRYLANLGTFHVHHWLGLLPGARAGQLHHLQKAEELISAAIDHNPDAHWGREVYQLKVIQALLVRNTSKKNAEEIAPWSDLIEMEGQQAQWEAKKAVEGYSGMIKLGSAWRSIDMFNNLRIALSVERRSSLAYAAELRMRELKGYGAKSEFLDEEQNWRRFAYRPEDDDKEYTEAWFQKARAAADERHEARLEYMEARFARGLHPDTDSEFWDDWEEPDFTRPKQSRFFTTKRIALGTLVISVGWLVAIGVRRGVKKWRLKDQGMS